MVAAMRRRFPGLHDASLARLDEQTWAAMFGRIRKVLAMEHAEIIHQG